MSDHEAEGDRARDPGIIPQGRILALNSRRLKAIYLKAIVGALGLPTQGSADQLRQLIEGKLETGLGRESGNVQVVVQVTTPLEHKLLLMDEGGVFQEADVVIQSKEGEASSSRAALQRALEEANEQLTVATQELSRERERAAELDRKLQEAEARDPGASGEEIQRLNSALDAEKEKYRQLWRLSCTQAREQEELLAAQETELRRLRSEPPSTVAHDPVSSRTSLSGRSSPGGSEQVAPRTRRPGKAPPVDPFTGEDREVRLDDWLPALQRVASWYGWSPEENLIQLAGHLRARALQEWNLLGESDRSIYDAGVKALRSRLDSGSRAMAAQEFRHCRQTDTESVSDFIIRLEKTFRLAYGRDQMIDDTRDALLYAQLHEGLRYKLMESPAVSGAANYSTLSVAARAEERRQAALQQRRNYRPDQTPHTTHQSDRFPRGPAPLSTHPKNSLPAGRNDDPVPNADGKLRRCWNCNKTGHFERDCKEPKKESFGRVEKRPVSAKRVETSTPVCDTESVDDPLQYLHSDSDSSDEVRQVRVPDLGSNSHTVVVNVQGVPVEGVVDTDADITIVGGSVFKQVAAVAKLRKKSFKPPDRTPRTYDRKPFRLDGRLDLDVSFGDKTLNTPVYVKMDASEPLLLSEGVCRQLGIVSYHPDVHPKNAKPETPNVAEATTIATVPSVRIKLVTSVRLPPKEAVAAEVQLEGIEKNYRGPWLLQSNDTVVEDLGVCVIDSLVTPTADATTKVVLTNRLGIHRRPRQA